MRRPSRGRYRVGMTAALDFWFDFSSPYSYLASTWIEPLAARHGRRVRWHAMLLGATLPAAELRPPASYPVKGPYMLRDFERSARFEGVPYRPPARFPIATQAAARIFWWLHAQDQARAAAWAQAGLAAYFADGLQLDESEALRTLLGRCGIDADAAIAAANDPAWKARLKAVNDEAIAAGIFGAPWIVVDGEPFWGNDRKLQVERWLAAPF